MTGEQFVDVFFNEETGRIAFALIKEEKRLFGADNTGGWHMHPFDDPEQHEAREKLMAFHEFIQIVEIKLL